MKLSIVSVIAAVFFLSLSASAQEAPADARSVEAVVNSYLSKVDANAVSKSLAPNAKIFSVAGARVSETPVSRPAAKSKGVVTVPQQKIVSIDVAGGGATVKVASDFEVKGEAPVLPKHFQFISLLKINGEWKIVSILMPPLSFGDQTAAK